MPSKYILRDFTEGNVYHIYNKGVANTNIFQDKNDYEIFLYYLFVYTQPLEKVLEKHPNLPFRLRYNNISTEVDILAYCLLPKRFHLVTRLHTQEGVSKLLKQLTNAYTYYFNRRHKTSGPKVAGRFKACLIDVDKQLTHLVRYLDRLPEEEDITDSYQTYPYSSHTEYTNTQENMLTKQRLIHSFFSTSQNYQNFITDKKDYIKSKQQISEILMYK